MKNQIEEPQNAISWTNEEMKHWVQAGLIPTYLLEPSRIRELTSFLLSNKKTLHDHYKADSSDEPFMITLPPPSDWENTYELQVIDKRTGAVVQTLDKGADLPFCEGVTLKIKAKELKEWTRTAEKAKKLTDEQQQGLKSFILKIGSERSLTRKEIITFIEEIQKPKKPQKYRQSGHLVDAKLKYSKPQKERDLFDLISPETQDKIKESKYEISAEGIKLSAPENKLLHAFVRLLHEKSENTRDPESSDFYAGNAPNEIEKFGNSESKVPFLKFKPSELYKAYMGHDDYSGHDANYINSILHQLESRKFLIKYDRVKKVKKGSRFEEKTDRIEDFASLIHIKSFIPDLSEEEKQKLDNGDHSIRNAKGEIIIALHPIFIDQIDTKFIEFPVDTNRRLVIAAGGHKKVTASMNTLMELLLREKSSGRGKLEFNEDTLPYALGLENYVKQGRKKQLQDRLAKDFDAIINMGILLKFEKVPNARGGLKWVFHINKEYE